MDKNTIEGFLEKLEELRESPLFERMYADGSEEYYSVDVKLHGVCIDESDIPEEIRSRFDDDEIELLEESLFEELLEDYRNFASEICMSGGLSIASPKPFWVEILEKIQNGETVGYPAIDNEESIDEKIKKWNEMMSEDEKILYNFAIVEDCYFLGRCGGHLCILVLLDPKEELDELIEEIEAQIRSGSREFYEYRGEYMDELYSIEMEISQISFVLDFFTEMKDKINWEEELKDRLNDMVESL